MKCAVRVLCRPEVAHGFALAGLAPSEAATVEDGIRQLRGLLETPDVGIVLVEEAMYTRVMDDLRRQVARRPLPMVVPFPGPAWTTRPTGAEAYIVELLRQVIGYRVRLR